MLLEIDILLGHVINGQLEYDKTLQVYSDTHLFTNISYSTTSTVICLRNFNNHSIYPNLNSPFNYPYGEPSRTLYNLK